MCDITSNLELGHSGYRQNICIAMLHFQFTKECCSVPLKQTFFFLPSVRKCTLYFYEDRAQEKSFPITNFAEDVLFLI